MQDWPHRQILERLRIRLPIIQAPMAGVNLSTLAIAVAREGGLGSIPCATLSLDQARREIEQFRAATSAPLNLNFFCHTPSPVNTARDARWKEILTPYYRELGLTPSAAAAKPSRAPFDEDACALVESSRAEIVSFHFGLPPESLLQRVKAAGALVLSSATTVEEARWLEEHGCDGIIAQGAEAGGHRGMFLSRDPHTQIGTMALVPQIVSAVRLPVIAAGGIADERGIAAAFALGAAAVQLGTAYMLCPESTLDPVHRAYFKQLKSDGTVLTNIFTGRPARGIVNRIIRELGPINPEAPEFPLASSAVTPLRAATPGRSDFLQMWAGQAAALCEDRPAGELTRLLAEKTLVRLA